MKLIFCLLLSFIAFSAVTHDIFPKQEHVDINQFNQAMS